MALKSASVKSSQFFSIVIEGVGFFSVWSEAGQPDGDYQMSGNQISVKTLDMNCEFAVIAGQLDTIAERVR